MLEEEADVRVQWAEGVSDSYRSEFCSCIGLGCDMGWRVLGFDTIPVFESIGFWCILLVVRLGSFN